MPKPTTVPLTPDLMARIGHLRSRMAAGDTPRGIAYVKARLAQAERNAEALYVLFGGQVDQASVDEAVFWRMELDSAYMRETLAA